MAVRRLYPTENVFGLPFFNILRENVDAANEAVFSSEGVLVIQNHGVHADTPEGFFQRVSLKSGAGVIYPRNSKNGDIFVLRVIHYILWP